MILLDLDYEEVDDRSGEDGETATDPERTRGLGGTDGEALDDDGEEPDANERSDLSNRGPVAWNKVKELAQIIRAKKTDATPYICPRTAVGQLFEARRPGAREKVRITG